MDCSIYCFGTVENNQLKYVILWQSLKCQSGLQFCLHVHNPFIWNNNLLTKIYKLPKISDFLLLLISFLKIETPHFFTDKVCFNSQNRILLKRRNQKLLTLQGLELKLKKLQRKIRIHRLKKLGLLHQLSISKLTYTSVRACFKVFR